LAARNKALEGLRLALFPKVWDWLVLNQLGRNIYLYIY
jgi:hypothetical protein